MSKIQERYPDFIELFAKKAEETSLATVTFGAVLALAEMLHDKGLIDYDDFIDRVYEELK
ncbi:hypothetical protein ACQKEY_19960 [Lysinibacillus fusiformis]|uniref:hypothetical protein n=1 Tax=Lysinibacillus fusiformis TaxID=28031 RepID=UPI003CFD8BE3